MAIYRGVLARKHDRRGVELIDDCWAVNAVPRAQCLAAVCRRGDEDFVFKVDLPLPMRGRRRPGRHRIEFRRRDPVPGAGGGDVKIDDLHWCVAIGESV